MSVKNMTAGAPWKHILKFSFPILAGAILQQLYNTVDTVIVGRFTGESALSAVGTTNTLVFFFLSIAIGFSAGNGVLVAQYFGAGDMEKVHRAGAAGIVFMLLAGAAASAAGIIFSRWLYIHFVAVPPGILDDTLLYFRIYCTGLLFQFGYNILSGILRAVGDSAATLYFLLLASVLNIFLDLWFVAYLDMGVAGAAVATNISQLVSVIAAWIYMHRKYPFFRYKLQDRKADCAIIRDTVKVGWPIAAQMMIVAMGISLIQRAVNGFGEVMTATFTVGQRIEMYLHLPCNALMTTLATFTGQNVGAKKLFRVKEGVKQGVLISFVSTLILAILIWFFARQLTACFGLGEAASNYSVQYLKATAFIVVILSLYVPVFGVFQGTKHAFIPTIVALCALTLRVVVTYLVKDGEFFGHTIIWWNGIFGFSLGCIITWCCYFSGIWKKNLTNLQEISYGRKNSSMA